MFGEITVGKLVDETAKRLAEAKEYTEQAYLVADKITKNKQVTREDIESLLVYTSNTFCIINVWEEYYNRFNTILVDKVEADSKEIQRLKGHIETLETEIERIRKEETNKVDKVVKTLQSTLDTINENAKLIAGSKGNREKQRLAVGNNSNRFIQELDTVELVKVYRANNNSIPKAIKEEYYIKYGITYNGLRERLIKAGVWKGRH